jgi:hypothetical protein
MMFQSGSGEPGRRDEIGQQGFEFVVGAQEQHLELLQSITAVLPDGRVRELRPSAEITGLLGPSAF